MYFSSPEGTAIQENGSSSSDNETGLSSDSFATLSAQSNETLSTLFAESVHKAENERRRKAYWAEGYPDIMSFFSQEPAKSVMTHTTAPDIRSWVHTSQLGEKWLQDKATMAVMEEEEEDVDVEVEMGMIGSWL